MQGRYLTVTAAASRLGTTPETIRRWLRAGKLTGKRPGGDKLGYRIDESELERLLVQGPVPTSRVGSGPRPAGERRTGERRAGERRRGERRAGVLGPQPQDLLASIVLASEDAIIALGPDGRITSWNPGAQRIFGYSAAEIVGQPCETLVPAERLDDHRVLRRRVAGGKPLRHHEAEYRRKDGRLVDAAGSAAPVLDSDGAVVAIALVLRDVTDQRHREEALRVREARTRAVLESAFDAIVTTDGAGRIVEFNPAAEQMFGHSRSEALGRWLPDLLLPASTGPWVPGSAAGAGADRAFTGRDLLNRRVEMRGLRADGSTFPVELALREINAADTTLFTGYVRDLTAQRAAEEELRASEERFRALAEAAFEAILIHQDGIIRAANRAFGELFRCDPPDAIGRSILEFTAPEWSDLVMYHARHHISELHELVARRADGTLVPVEAVGRTVPFASGVARVVVCRERADATHPQPTRTVARRR